jgi:hypothetical protein
MDTDRLQELKRLVLSRLDEHPALREIYPDNWVQQQFRAGPAKGFHPVVQILLGFTHGPRLAAGMEKAWLAVSQQKAPGDVASRRSRLAGSPDRSWQDNHRDWWSCIAEVYLAAYLVTQGYGVQLSRGDGPDLALTVGQDDPVGHVEVHSPRQTLEAREFDHHLFWALQDKARLGLSLTARPSWDSLSFTGDNAVALARQVAQLYDTIASQKTLPPLKRRLTVANGCIDVEIGPGIGGTIGYRGEARCGGPGFPTALFDDIIARAEGKRRQLSAAPRWAVLAVEVAAYHTIPLYIHLLNSAALGNAPFPAERLPKCVAGLIIYPVDLTELEPHAALACPNPHSPWAQEPSLVKMLRLFDLPLRRKGHAT